MERDKVSRREFLKMSTIGAVALTTQTLNISEGAEVEPVSKVRFRFGEHLLTPKDVEGVEKVILGEVAQESIIFWHIDRSDFKKILGDNNLGEDFVNSFLKKIVYSSYEQQSHHLDSIAKAKEGGKALVATDSFHIETLKNSWWKENIENVYTAGWQRTLALILTGTVSASALAELTGRKNKKTGTPEELSETKNSNSKKITSAALTTALSTSIILTAISLRELADEGFLELPKLKPVSEASNKLVFAMTGFGDKEKKELVNLIAIRNLSMALNTHIVQQTLEQIPSLREHLTAQSEKEKIDILFYAGGGHIDAENEYLQGIDYLSQRIKSEVNHTINYSKQRISAAKTKSEEKKALDLWIGLTSGYSYPIPTYALRSEFQQRKPLNLPDSPRTILWKELYSRYGNDPDDEIIVQMIRRLAGEDVVFQTWASVIGDPANPVYLSVSPEVAAMRERTIQPNMPRTELPIPISVILPEDLATKQRGYFNRYLLRISEGIPYIIPVY